MNKGLISRFPFGHGVEGTGLVPWVGGPPGCFSWVSPKRSISKPDEQRKDIVQQESLGTDML